MSSFFASHYTFEGKKEHENVKLFLYRHWITILLKIIVIVIGTIVPVVAYLTFHGFIVKYALTSLFFFTSTLYYLALWYFLFYSLTMYVLDYWIVTDMRVIDNKQQGFFHRTVSELQLSRVQDISITTSGIIPTIFHFGDLEIQTAGAEKKFLFKHIAYPQTVKDTIMKLVAEHRRHSEPLVKEQRNNL